ncbi:ribonuclease H-like domain-containing protein [Tanacetum coccineum]
MEFCSNSSATMSGTSAVNAAKQSFSEAAASIKHMTGNKSLQIIKKLMVDLLHLEEVLKEVKLLEKVILELLILKKLFFLDVDLFMQKATLDESNLWHRRLGHINFKTMNNCNGKPCKRIASKFFEIITHTCVAVRREATQSLLCLVTILNTLDPLGKFDGKADEGFLVGYSINSKAFRVLTQGTRKGIKLIRMQSSEDAIANLVKRLMKNQQMRVKEIVKRRKEELQIKKKEGYATSTNRVSIISPSVSAVGQSFDNVDDLLTNPLMPDLEDTTNLLNTGIFSGAYDDEDEGVKADLVGNKSSQELILPRSNGVGEHSEQCDYALWEVIDNGNSWVPIPVTAPETGPSIATKMTVPSTAKEKTCKKNDLDLEGMKQQRRTQEGSVKQQCKTVLIFNTVNPEVSTGTTKVNTASTEIKMIEKWNMALLCMGHVECLTAIKWGTFCTENAAHRNGAGCGLEWTWQRKKFSQIMALWHSRFCEKEGMGFEFKIVKFEKSAKYLDQLLASQITDKSKKGFGYNVVPSPHPLILNRPTPLDLSYSGLEEFKELKVNEYGPRDSSLNPTTGCDKESDNSKENTDDSLKQQQKIDSKTSSVKSLLKVDKDCKEEPKKARENNDAPIIEDWVSDDEDDDELTYGRLTTGRTFLYVGLLILLGHLYCSPKNNSSLAGQGNGDLNTGKALAYWVWRPSNPNVHHWFQQNIITLIARGRSKLVDSGCSRHMTGNIAYLSDFKILMEVCYFWWEEHLEAKLLAKLPDENHILLKIPRQDNMYSFDMKNIVPKDSLTCLVAKATSEESMLWHRRFGHINFKNINKLVKENLVRDLPLKIFENDQTCVACLKGKQHRASSERKNRTLIEAARTMLADSKLPTTFWAEAVSTTCYVQNRVLIVKPHNKTPYELFRDQDCIVMPIWNDASYFGDDAPRSIADTQIQDKHRLQDENDATEKSHEDSSLKDNGTTDQQVNTASPEVNTGSE